MATSCGYGGVGNLKEDAPYPQAGTVRPLTERNPERLGMYRTGAVHLVQTAVEHTHTHTHHATPNSSSTYNNAPKPNATPHADYEN